MKIEKMCDQCIRKIMSPDEVIFKQGDEPDYLYFVIDGTVVVYKEVRIIVKNRWPTGHSEHQTVSMRNTKMFPVMELYKGAYFGEISIMKGSVRTATLKAKTKCVLLALARTEFMNMLRHNRTMEAAAEHAAGYNGDVVVQKALEDLGYSGAKRATSSRTVTRQLQLSDTSKQSNLDSEPQHPVEGSDAAGGIKVNEGIQTESLESHEATSELETLSEEQPDNHEETPPDETALPLQSEQEQETQDVISDITSQDASLGQDRRVVRGGVTTTVNAASAHNSSSSGTAFDVITVVKTDSTPVVLGRKNSLKNLKLGVIGGSGERSYPSPTQQIGTLRRRRSSSGLTTDSNHNEEFLFNRTDGHVDAMKFTERFYPAEFFNDSMLDEKKFMKNLAREKEQARAQVYREAGKSKRTKSRSLSGVQSSASNTSSGRNNGNQRLGSATSHFRGSQATSDLSELLGDGESIFHDVESVSVSSMSKYSQNTGATYDTLMGRHPVKSLSSVLRKDTQELSERSHALTRKLSKGSRGSRRKQSRRDIDTLHSSSGNYSNLFRIDTESSSRHGGRRLGSKRSTSPESKGTQQARRYYTTSPVLNKRDSSKSKNVLKELDTDEVPLSPGDNSTNDVISLLSSMSPPSKSLMKKFSKESSQSLQVPSPLLIFDKPPDYLPQYGRPLSLAINSSIGGNTGNIVSKDMEDRMSSKVPYNRLSPILPPALEGLNPFGNQLDLDSVQSQNDVSTVTFSLNSKGSIKKRVGINAGGKKAMATGGANERFPYSTPDEKKRSILDRPSLTFRDVMNYSL